ncbi:MAG: hypothetical protein DRQ51_10580 [Gammaproteobacteria bacterium]|nr:MAG: hypothetical protein DRQ51_10580 [Gammaproteobacteria bacterium]
MKLIPKNYKDELKTIDAAIDSRFNKLNDFDISLLPHKNMSWQRLKSIAYIYDLKLPDTIGKYTAKTLIKQALQNYKYIGSAYALKKILDALFPVIQLQEWFEYGGEPFYFKIKLQLSRWIAFENKLLFILMDVINKNKSYRSKLESLDLKLPDMPLPYIVSAAAVMNYKF